jgi:hypothetical protein
VKENPWAKKHQKSAGLLAQKRAKKPVQSSRTRSTSSSSLASLRSLSPVERARKRLFDAGWRPSDIGQPVTGEIHAALLALAAANRKATQAAIRNARHS